MADFQEVMRQWKRMCNAMGQENEYTACDKCDLHDFGCPAIYEKECDSADWKHVERVVAKWAAANPEPVFPTWKEWLLAAGYAKEIDDGFGCIITNFDWNTPMPSDIAQKLGIEPKEG